MASANINYAKPLNNEPRGSVNLSGCKGKLNELESEGKASYLVPVEVYDGETLVAEFEGTYKIIK